MKLKLARIGRPHGVRGEVTAEIFTDDPQARFAPGTVVETDRPSRPTLEVTGVRWHQKRLLLTIDGVRDRNAAEELRGIVILGDPLSAEDACVDSGSSGEEGWYPHEIEGLDVVVAGEVVGKVLRLELRGPQDLLVVELSGGQEAYVPFVEQIVPVVDVAAGRIELTPPVGLLDVNLPGGSA